MDKYYVYQHLDSGSVVYVGKGSFDRAWSLKRANEEHINWMKQKLPYLDVDIVESNLAEEDALEMERQLILKLQPKFNSFHTARDKTRLENQGKWLSTEKSRFGDPELQKELGKRAVKSPGHPNNVLLKCIHCNVEMNVGHIKRYHNDNCKKRVSINDTN